MPDEIPAAEFETLLPHLPTELANRWYKLDENSVCPRPDGTGQTRACTCCSPGACAGNWADEVEGPLGDAFRRAARAVGLWDADRRKYEASATHQELDAGAFHKPDAQEHVITFIREMRTADGQALREALLHDAVLRDFMDLLWGDSEEAAMDLSVILSITARNGATIGERSLAGMPEVGYRNPCLLTEFLRR